MKKFIVLAAFISTLLMFVFTTGNKVQSIQANTSIYKTNVNEDYDDANSYYTIFNQWLDEKVQIPSKTYPISKEHITGGQLKSHLNSFGYGKEVISINPSEEFSFEVNVEQSGLYEINFDYLVLNETRLKPSVSLKINHEIQFNEMNNLILPIKWKLEDEIKKDQFGDEIMPKSTLSEEWRNFSFIDPNYFYKEPLKFYFNTGVNKVSISVQEGHLMIGDIRVTNDEHRLLSYKEYKNSLPLSNSINYFKSIQAEDLVYKSRESIRSKYLRDPSVTPYEFKNRVLNVIDGYSFNEAGDEITYNFDVPETGLYQLTIHYYQNANNGLSSRRSILIDGKIPFEELASYEFEYVTKWKNETLSDNKDRPYEFYLEKGSHSITLAIDNIAVREVYHNLKGILDEISSLSREVNRLTGGITDKDRKWKITKYLPDAVVTLKSIQERIDENIELIKELYGTDASIISELEIASRNVKWFIDKPDDLPAYMHKFNESDGSVYARINTILPLLTDHPLHLDAIYVHGGEHDLPKANASFFKEIWEKLRSFVYSFFDPKYNQTQKNSQDTIEIWVSKPRLYVELMQRMIDEEFTPETGIKVQLAIMPDENKIILANAANKTPDGAIGISHGRPFELAIRNVTVDLRGYDGFYELAEEYSEASFIPFVYEEGVYALPETQDVKLLFYRKDILNFLGVEAPQTWEEVVTLIPLLQKYNMNFYTPIGGASSLKGIGETSPFIYQFGGAIYDETGTKTIINTGEAFEAFEFMTDLFTVYNLPNQISSFYQKFRDGSIPLGIGGTNEYIQLKYAAPELAGQWGVQPIPGINLGRSAELCPGTPNENGECIERWDPTFGSASIIFKSSEKQDQTWQLLKWWHSKEAQSDFSYNIQSTLGSKFLYMTANIEGFKTSAWPSDSKAAILEQWNWIQSTSKVPGDYMVEREISNQWNKVVFEGENPRVAIENATMIINRELERKLKEFDYIVDGKLIKPYKVATIDNIHEWVRKDE